MAKKMKKSDLQKQSDTIYNYFKENTDRTYTLSDVYNHLNVYEKDDKNFVKLLVEELEEQGKLTQVGRNRYVAGQGSKNVVQGRIDHVNARFGFVRQDGDLKDIYVETDYLAGAMDGDLVTAQVTKPAGKGGDKPEGKVVEILERGRKQVVGRMKTFGNYALVTPESRNLYEDFFVAKSNMGDGKTNDLVILDIIDYPTGLQQGTGRVAEVLGQAGENNAEMHAIVTEYGFPIHFPEEVEKEAEAISTEITKEEVARRRDFRGTLTFTIDPVDAKDFDDALSFKKLDNGNFEIGVHIADVTHYVRPGTALEEEAYSRATSVYLVDRTIPMLPEKLSNGLCSLRPNEDKLVFSAVFELTPEAKLVNEWFGRCVIHSDKRFTYEEAQEQLETPENEVREGYKPYYEALQTLNKLAKIIKDERFANGAINFETVEVRFKLDEKGVPQGVMIKERKDAHRLIEEYMLLANKQVARFVHHLGQGKKQKKKADETEGSVNTMVYRIHEPPNVDKLETFSKFAARLGYSIKTNSQNSLSQSYNHLMDEIAGTPMQNVLEQLAVRTMSKARYGVEPLGHFGLAFDHYSHFTSPIRRYPDMMAHRLLQHYLDSKPSPDAAPYAEKCKHSSEREKQASDAERASIKYKQVEFISNQDPNTVYDGVITGVTDFGIFVEMNGTNSEGVLRLSDLGDDYYEYDADNYRLVGKRSGKLISFGDAVKVKVKSTDLQNRTIELSLESHGNQSYAKKRPSDSPRGRVGGRRRTEKSGSAKGGRSKSTTAGKTKSTRKR